VKAKSPAKDRAKVRGRNPVRGRAKVRVKSPARDRAEVRVKNPAKDRAKVKANSLMRDRAKVKANDPARHRSPVRGKGKVGVCWLVVGGVPEVEVRPTVAVVMTGVADCRAVRAVLRTVASRCFFNVPKNKFAKVR